MNLKKTVLRLGASVICAIGIYGISKYRSADASDPEVKTICETVSIPQNNWINAAVDEYTKGLEQLAKIQEDPEVKKALNEGKWFSGTSRVGVLEIEETEILGKLKILQTVKNSGRLDVLQDMCVDYAAFIKKATRKPALKDVKAVNLTF